MLHLPNNCRCSTLAVHPTNWNSSGCDISKDWYIHYRFYNHDGRTRQVILKGMNKFKSIGDRRAATRLLLDNEIGMLQGGYNPITRQIKDECIATEISPDTGFYEALEYAKGKIKGASSTIRDIRSVMAGTKEALQQLRLYYLEISNVKRRHVKAIIEQVQKNAGDDSAHRYNKYRTYLILLFRELVDIEVIDTNPAIDIRKMKVTQRLREILTKDERRAIDDHLKVAHPSFHRFVHIFFHSGARLTEITQVRRSHVDLEGQRWKCLIKKGREYREVWKPIKTIALEYWRQAINECTGDDYLFSRGLRPGQQPIGTDRITKIWKKKVKDDLSISKDFYSLKHLNTDETSAALGISAAAEMNNHTTPVITMKHYAVNEKSRMDEQMKNLNNSFS